MKNSTSAVIRKEIQSIMSDQQQRDIAQIKEELEQRGYKYQDNYQESHLSSVLSLMRKAGQIHQISRGVYSASCPVSQLISQDNLAAENFSESDVEPLSLPLSSPATEPMSFSDLMPETICQLQNSYCFLEQAMNRFPLSSISSIQDMENFKVLFQLRFELLALINKYNIGMQGNNTAQ